MSNPIRRCDWCPAPGHFGFSWGSACRHACRVHRDEGRAWLDRAKGADERETGKYTEAAE